MRRITKAALSFLTVLGAINMMAVDMSDIFINGFFSQGYLKSSDNSLYTADTEDGTWEFNEAAISIKALLGDNTSAGIQLMSRDFGDSGNNELNVDWAFLDHRFNDWLGVRVGKFKKPEGLYNSVRDADAVRTSILLPQGIYSEEIRDIQIAIQGVGLYGFVDLGEGGSLDYTAYLGSQPINKEDPIINDLLGDFFGILEDGDVEFKYSYGVQLFWNTPVTGLRFGQSFNSALFEVNGTNTRYPWFSPVIEDGELESTIRATTSFEYQKDRLTLNGEYMIWNMESPNAPAGGPITPLGFPAGGLLEFERTSYYLQLTYQVTDSVQLGTYYSWDKNSGTDNEDAPQNHLDDWVISARYDVNSWWLLKAEMHFFDGYLGVNPDESGVLEESWNMIAIKSTVSF